MQKKFRVRGTLNRRRTTITIQYNLTQETKEAHNVSLIDKNSLHEKKETYQEVKNTGKDGSELDPSADSTRDNVLLMLKVSVIQSEFPQLPQRRQRKDKEKWPLREVWV